ncbi:MAG: type II secretion system protein [Planctomycetes bacterium]|nr:type II secretion system protein [Planctomycetota bacterium]
MNRSGFSLIELMLVIGVMIALAGMVVVTIPYFKKQAELAATRSLVNGISAAVSYYRPGEALVPASPPDLPTQKIRRFWDFNLATTTPFQDGLLDGDPDMDPTFTAADRLAARLVGYRGFLGQSGHAVPTRHCDRNGCVIDSWKRVLHIRFAANTYGSSGFGVWSNGPDGIEGTKDDIKSWTDE